LKKEDRSLVSRTTWCVTSNNQ